MKNFIIYGLIMIVILFSCRSIRGLKVFSKCCFDLKKIEDIRIADIDVSKIKSYSDFNYKDIAKLSNCFLTKKVPLSLTFVVNITNNSKKIAKLERLDYIIAVNGRDIMSGKIDKQIVVSPKTNSLYYIKSELDVMNLFNKDEIKDNIQLALQLISSDNIYKEIEIRVRPYIKVGDQFISTPEFISVKYKD